MRTPLAVALLTLVTACDRHSSVTAPQRVQPAPPQGSGVEAIAMDGSWRVVSAERIDVQPTQPNVESSLPLGLFPEFDVVDGQLRDFAGRPLFEPEVWDDGDFYANVTDGRTLWFEVFDFDAAEPSHIALQMIFGSFGPDDLLGFVTVRTFGMPFQGQFLQPHDGMYLVHMARVYHVPGGILIPPPGGIILPPLDQPAGQPAAAPTSVR